MSLFSFCISILNISNTAITFLLTNEFIVTKYQSLIRILESNFGWFGWLMLGNQFCSLTPVTHDPRDVPAHQVDQCNRKGSVA